MEGALKVGACLGERGDLVKCQVSIRYHVLLPVAGRFPPLSNLMDKMQIDVYRRMDDGWMLESYTIGDAVAFESIGFTIPIEEIYADVVRLP